VQEGPFKVLVSKLMDIFALNKNAIKIILPPPPPRYVTGSCCDDVGHANNRRDPVKAISLCKKVGGLRRILKEQVVKSGIEKVWIPDIMGGLFGDGEGSGLNGKDLIKGAGGIFSKDNVHLSHLGFEKITGLIIGGIEKIVNKSDAAAVLPNAGVGKHYWRGFCSERGATKAHHAPRLAQQRKRTVLRRMERRLQRQWPLPERDPPISAIDPKGVHSKSALERVRGARMSSFS